MLRNLSYDVYWLEYCLGFKYGGSVVQYILFSKCIKASAFGKFHNGGNDNDQPRF